MHYMASHLTLALYGGWTSTCTAAHPPPSWSAQVRVLGVCVIALRTLLMHTMPGTGLAARAGLLVKSGQAVEEAAGATEVVFDKTGTLTLGSAAVSAMFIVREGKGVMDQYMGEGRGGDECMALEGSPEELVGVCVAPNASMCTAVSMPANVQHILWLAMCTERDSEHPIGKAIVDFARCGQSLPEASEEDVTDAHCGTGEGRGVRRRVQGREVTIGSLDYLLHQEQRLSDTGCDVRAAQAVGSQLQARGAIVVYMSVDGAMTALFELADQVRPDAHRTIARLREKGLRVWMVTGDHRRTAEAVGKLVGLSSDDIIAGSLPQGKLAFVQARQEGGGKVVFVGDGERLCQWMCVCSYP